MPGYLIPLAAALAVLAWSNANAQDSVAAVAAFYKGRQISVIVGSSPGGGFDLYARLLARHLPNR